MKEDSNVSYKREFECLLTRESQKKIQMSLIRDYSNVFDKKLFKRLWQERIQMS